VTLLQIFTSLENHVKHIHFVLHLFDETIHNWLTAYLKIRNACSWITTFFIVSVKTFLWIKTNHCAWCLTLWFGHSVTFKFLTNQIIDTFNKLVCTQMSFFRKKVNLNMWVVMYVSSVCVVYVHTFQTV